MANFATFIFKILLAFAVLGLVGCGKPRNKTPKCSDQDVINGVKAAYIDMSADITMGAIGLVGIFAGANLNSINDAKEEMKRELDASLVMSFRNITTESIDEKNLQVVCSARVSFRDASGKDNLLSNLASLIPVDLYYQAWRTQDGRVKVSILNK